VSVERITACAKTRVVYWIGVAGFALSACALQNSASTQIPSLPLPEPTTTVQEPTNVTDDLDLLFANVVAVQFEKLDKDTYRFDVTLFHDDDGEAPEYADWWQVDDLQGNELGRRVLLHAHSTAPFTRSQEIMIEPSIRVVIIRGHDMRHGYGGQIMRVDMESGVITALPHP
jgi:hypothetical protein